LAGDDIESAYPRLFQYRQCRFSIGKGRHGVALSGEQAAGDSGTTQALSQKMLYAS
jgi:hypothetical protein